MKTFHKQLAVAFLVAVCTCSVSPLLAQQNTQRKASSSTVKDQKSTGARRMHDASTKHKMDKMDGSAMNVSDDAEFLKKAYEGGQAEITLGRLAQERATSDLVKNFAQMMVDDHTMANQAIAAALSGKNDMDRMVGDATNPSNANPSGMGAGTGTGTGIGTGSSGTMNNSSVGNDATNNSSTVPGTAGTAAGSSSTSIGVGTNSSANSNNSNTAVTNVNPNNNVNTGIPVDRPADMDNQVVQPPMANPSRPNTDVLGNMDKNAKSVAMPGMGMNNQTWLPAASADLKAKESYILTTELNAEHKALEARLSKLSGAQFEREYLKAMVKDHDKMLKMVDAKAEEDKSGSPTLAQAWAKQHQTAIRQHKEKAEGILEQVGK